MTVALHGGGGFATIAAAARRSATQPAAWRCTPPLGDVG
jgi:hypothetical protein